MDAVIETGFEEEGCLPELGAFLCAREVGDDVVYQVFTVVIGYHVAVSDCQAVQNRQLDACRAYGLPGLRLQREAQEKQDLEMGR